MNVNFTVFLGKIRSGEKRQTIRRAGPKWANVKAGDKLTLYTGLRTKQCRKLGEAVVDSITPIYLFPAQRRAWIKTQLGVLSICDDDLELIAIMDGFNNLCQFWQFFAEKYGDEESEFNVIRWTDFKEASVE